MSLSCLRRCLPILLVLLLPVAGALWAKGRYQPKITLGQARAAALQAVPGGVVKSGELEKEKGRWVYSFDITAGRVIREVWVDPESGKVLLNEEESAAQERREGK